MKKVIGSLLMCSIYFVSFSQARINNADFQKNNVSSIEIEIPYSTQIVAGAIEEKMQKAGYKGKESKGYILYREAKVSEFGNQAYDLYLKTEKKSKKEKENSIVTLLISTGLEQFVKLDAQATVLNEGKKFLDSLVPAVQDYDLSLQITAQETEIKNVEKKLTALQENGQSLQKKKEKLEKEIEENKQKTEEQQSEIAKQKQIGVTLKSKRKI
jgi:hypothetical protein